jgi:hypothetical protein
VEYWTIVGDNSNQNNFVKLHFSPMNKSDFWLYYYEKAPYLSSGDDVCILPDRYGVDLVALLTAGELLYETEQNTASVNLLNK